MSIVVNLNDLTLQQKEYIKSVCVIPLTPDDYRETKKCVCFRVVDDKISLPFGLWKKFNKENTGHPPIDITFKGELYSKETDVKGRDQDEIVKEALAVLSYAHSCFLSLPT